MRRYGTLLAVGLTIALSGGLSLTSAAAHAAVDDCTSVVGDLANALSPDQVTELQHHAAALGSTTMLRIRTVTSTNGQTLNAYEEAEQQSCGWADAANVREPTLLVILVATQDRQMGIYPGPALVGTLTDPVWLAIEQQDMRPSFAHQDWLGGLEAGVDALQEVLVKGAPPATAPTAAGLPTAGPIRYDANGNLIQGDGSEQHPFVEDPNGILPGSQNGIGATTTNSGVLVGLFVGLFVVLAVIGLVVAVAKGGGSGRTRNRGYRGPDGVWIGGIDPLHQQHHNPGMFGTGGGGFGGGGDMGGGGGSSSDGGGGSSGF